MKQLAADLKVFLAKSEQDRLADFRPLMPRIRKEIQIIQKETLALLKEFDKEMKQLAADLKVFLAKSERDRIADFKPMMDGIRKDVRHIQSETHALLKQLDKEIDVLKKETAHLLGDYEKERHEAAGYWAALSKKGKAAYGPAGKKRGRPRKSA